MISIFAPTGIGKSLPALILQRRYLRPLTPTPLDRSATAISSLSHPRSSARLRAHCAGLTARRADHL